MTSLLATPLRWHPIHSPPRPFDGEDRDYAVHCLGGCVRESAAPRLGRSRVAWHAQNW